jgi:hypothetical protein
VVFTVHVCPDAWATLVAVRPMARSASASAEAIENARRTNGHELSDDMANPSQ